MPTWPAQHSVQYILNRVFLASSNRLVTGRDSSTAHNNDTGFQAQEILNRVHETSASASISRDRLRLDG